MKKVLVLLLVVVVLGLAANAIFQSGLFPRRYDTSFATQISVRFHHQDKSIDTVITDANEVKALKEMFAEPAYGAGVPSCGFDPNISLTLKGGRKSMTFYPGCDECAAIRVGEDDRYIGLRGDQKERFFAIVKKYGMTFPCL